jgi:pimeloyl-ACP methyl ester carboxylesterase
VETHFIQYRNSSIHYYRYGSGPEWLFCFHGYGEDGSSFGIFETILGDRFTMIAVDLPFHGRTNWQEGLLFDVADLLAIIHTINPIHHPFSLLGYSMGGRVAMQVLQSVPQQVAKLVLVAPDGLHKNKWQWLATRTRTGNRLFSFTMRNPSWMIKLIDLGGKLGLYDKSLLRFVHYYLDDAEQRRILFRRWTAMRKFRPRRHLLKEMIITRRIPVHILFGRYDRVILAKHGIHFSKHAENLIQVTEIEAGHQLLKEKHVSMIAEWLK